MTSPSPSQRDHQELIRAWQEAKSRHPRPAELRVRGDAMADALAALGRERDAKDAKIKEARAIALTYADRCATLSRSGVRPMLPWERESFAADSAAAERKRLEHNATAVDPGDTWEMSSSAVPAPKGETPHG